MAKLVKKSNGIDDFSRGLIQSQLYCLNICYVFSVLYSGICPMKAHKISLFSAILMNLNIMIGSGILIGSYQSAAIAGNASFLGWLVVFACFLPLVLSIIQLSSLFPQVSGVYLYAKEGLGWKAGFASAWLYITGYTLTMVIECLALRETLAITSNHYWLFDSPLIFNALLIGFCVVASLASMKLVSGFLNSLTIVKLLPLIILILLIPFIYNPSFTVTPAELKMLPFSLPLLMFGYFGFEYCTAFSNMIEDSEKNAPRAILLGFLATALIYTLFHFGLLQLMGLNNLVQYQASSFANFIDLPVPYLKPFLQFLIPVASSITLFAVTLGVLNSNATLLHSLGTQNLLHGSSFISRTNLLGRPSVALALQGLAAFILTALIPSIAVAGPLCVFAVFLSFILPLLALITVLHTRKLTKKLPMAYMGFVSVLCFTAYSWYCLGETVAERIQYTLLLVTILGIGLALMKRK